MSEEEISQHIAFAVSKLVFKYIANSDKLALAILANAEDVDKNAYLKYYILIAFEFTKPFVIKYVYELNSRRN